MNKIEIEPEYDDTNSTMEDFLSAATKPPTIFREKKSLQYKSGMNVLGMGQKSLKIKSEISLVTICLKSESECH